MGTASSLDITSRAYCETITGSIRHRALVAFEIGLEDVSTTAITCDVLHWGRFLALLSEFTKEESLEERVPLFYVEIREDCEERPEMFALVFIQRFKRVTKMFYHASD